MRNGVDPGLLQQFEPLSAIRPDTVERLARAARIIEHSRGATLFARGDTATDAVFLVRGTVDLLGEHGGLVRRLRADERLARHRLVHQSPRRLSARCASAVTTLLMDAALLDVTLTWEQQSLPEAANSTPLEPAPVPDGVATGDWMLALLKTPLFQRLPAESLQGLFRHLQPLDLRAGDTVIQQGDEAKYFYVLTAGRCRVSRRAPTGSVLTLAEFAPGASFGEEALISGEPRNATVTMLSDGRLMRLGSADFRELLKEPLTPRVSAWQARRMMSAGSCRWLDVRLQSEYECHHVPGALNQPLHMLRLRMGALDRSLRYICYCDTGRRSAVAAFLLRNAGYDAWLLDRGLASAAL